MRIFLIYFYTIPQINIYVEHICLRQISKPDDVCVKKNDYAMELYSFFSFTKTNVSNAKQYHLLAVTVT